MPAPLLHSIPYELFSIIISRMTFSSIKKLVTRNSNMRKRVFSDLFFWKSQVDSPDEFNSVKEILKAIKRDYLVEKALVKGKTSVKIIETHQLDITMLRVDRNQIICSSDDTTIKLFRLDTISCKKFLGHLGGVWDFAYNEKVLASSSVDKTVRVWDLKTGKCNFVLTGHTSTVRTVKIYNNNIISGGRDGSIRIWNQNGTSMAVFQDHRESVRCLDAKNNELISGSYDGRVLLYDLIKFAFKKELTSHDTRVYCVLILKDFYVSAGLDSIINVTSKDLKNVFKCKLHKGLIASLHSFDYKGKIFLVSCGLDSIIGIWDLKGASLYKKISGISKLTSLRVFKKYLIVATDTSVLLYCAITGRILRVLLEKVQIIHCIDFNDNVLGIGYRSAGKCLTYVCNFNEILERIDQQCEMDN